MSKIEVATNKNGSDDVPCCNNCIFAVPNGSEDAMECHKGPPPTGVPLPAGPGLNLGGRQQVQVAIHWPWRIVMKRELCGDHPKFYLAPSRNPAASP